jgi:hypothetical protein
MAQTLNIKGFVSGIEIQPDEYLLPLQEVIDNIAKQEQLNVEFEYSEVFHATVNNEDCCNLIKQSTEINNFKIK